MPPRCQGGCSRLLTSVHPEIPGHCVPCGDRWIAATYMVRRLDTDQEFRCFKSSVRWGLDCGRTTMAAAILRTEETRLKTDVPYWLPAGASTRGFGIRVSIIIDDSAPEALMVGAA